ncbi:MAG: fluoride efflux transporter CrcB [Opitutaceae bacterium]|nr:fluoride efflux transporter CrcB [Opitutaceae bacterium]
MNVATVLLIAAGGALGSVIRAVAGQVVPAGRLPWATLTVNIAGSFLIGCLMARFAIAPEGHVRAHAFWVVGVCGGFTTFSAFSWQTFEQLQRGHWFAAALNVTLSVLLCLAATWLGWRLAR